MANSLEAIWNVLAKGVDNLNEPKSPLHIGEVMDCWTYVTALGEFIRYEEICLNTTTDSECREMLVGAIKMCENQSARLSEFMKKEGIPLPEVTAPKPNSEPNAIPLGVKFTDDEIANGVTLKLTNAMMLSSKGQVDAIRSDLGIMWVKFHLEMVTFGTTLKSLMLKRGWLKVPPYYYPPGQPS
ncbi:DUF3231 family protein [Alkalihalobacillus sp. MEB130]|uniref:DUF3231 family protein n=1 Tax=Alkalihalobacillus sp. MEB130 TaxID=2976704 RepID=UPI0028E09827|nr:DUF3231 family protein [Alkalihalobacillus sp. MEB130]MDT8861419.1 DUF3231 family protein [Alkalihalobacillus sp. MEB130]